MTEDIIRSEIRKSPRTLAEILETGAAWITEKELADLVAENQRLKAKLTALVEAIENDGYEGYLFQSVRDALEAAKEQP